MNDPRTVPTELGADAARILQAYRRHADEQPSAALDQRILAMATAALQQTAAAPVRQHRPLHWLRYAASVAVVVVGAGLTWRMLEEGPAPGRELGRASMETAMPAPAMAPGASAGAGPASARTDPSATADAVPSAVPAPAPAPAPAVVMEQAAAAASPRARGEHASAPQHAGAVAAPENREPAAATAPAAVARMPIAALPPPPAAPATSTPPQVARPSAVPASKAGLQTAPAQDAAAPVAAKRAAERPQVSPLDPQQWLQSVRALRNSGHLDAARVSLREWRLRHPQLAVPEDLQSLLDAADSPVQPR